MLLTRCPDCDTTFRVTDDALKKANGRVRCGRCASVFNAYAERHEPGTPPAPRAGEPPSEPPATATAVGSQPVAAPEGPPPPPPVSLSRDPTPATAPTTTPTDPTAASIGATSVADVVAQVEAGAADENAITGELDMRSGFGADDAISAAEVESVLAVDTRTSPSDAPQWTLLGEVEPKRASRWWGVAATLAVSTLGLQAVNHYRSVLAGHEVVGRWVQQAYATLGVTVTPNWDVRQYEILDWVATAEPAAGGLGSLKITARIQNHGPLRQPYPAVHLRLKDRWEEAVGSRMFAPTEYLPSDAPRGRLMGPGETARAEIEVVDPGPDAYGFELDVCIEVETNALSCGSDKVFL